jgi:hypothetical protein
MCSDMHLFTAVSRGMCVPYGCRSCGVLLASTTLSNRSHAACLLLCRLSTLGMQLPLVLRTPSPAAAAGCTRGQPSVLQGLVQLLSTDEVRGSRCWRPACIAQSLTAVQCAANFCTVLSTPWHVQHLQELCPPLHLQPTSARSSAHVVTYSAQWTLSSAT